MGDGGRRCTRSLLLGGTLSQYATWRWCLFVNVAIAGAALMAGRAVRSPVRGHEQSRVDLPVLAINQGGEQPS